MYILNPKTITYNNKIRIMLLSQKGNKAEFIEIITTKEDQKVREHKEQMGQIE